MKAVIACSLCPASTCFSAQQNLEEAVPFLFLPSAYYIFSCGEPLSSNEQCIERKAVRDPILANDINKLWMTHLQEKIL